MEIFQSKIAVDGNNGLESVGELCRGEIRDNTAPNAKTVELKGSELKGSDDMKAFCSLALRSF